WGCSRSETVGKIGGELCAPISTASIEAADKAALNSPDGQFRNEFEVDRAGERRMVGSIRIVVRDESNKPEFLMLVFEDITDRRSLSQELRARRSSWSLWSTT